MAAIIAFVPCLPSESPVVNQLPRELGIQGKGGIAYIDACISVNIDIDTVEIDFTVHFVLIIDRLQRDIHIILLRGDTVERIAAAVEKCYPISHLERYVIIRKTYGG